jgi:broad specificity phosphatase PhoE
MAHRQREVPMAQRFLFLVRHGQYAKDSALPGDSDGSLTALGREQATLAAERLAGLPAATIHHSTLRRAIETAAIIATRLPGAPLHPSPLLRECIPSIPPGFESLFTHFPPERVARDGLQAEEAFATYFAPPPDDADDQHEVIVCHGNLIRFLVCRVLGAPRDAWIHTDIQLCGISEVTIGGPHRITLERHNDVGHLPPHLRLYV